jgi:hypothetical protein
MVSAVEQTAAAGQSPSVPSTGADRFWNLQFKGLLGKGSSPLGFYARDRDGVWVAAVGTSRDPAHGRRTFNRSYACGDFSGAPIRDGVFKGQLVVHMTPDPWVPSDQKSFPLVLEVDAKLEGTNRMAGTYRLLSVATESYDTNVFGRAGAVTGESSTGAVAALADSVTVQCYLQGAKTGGEARSVRCIILQLGYKAGKLASVVTADLDTGGRTYGALLDPKAAPLGDGTGVADRDAFRARVAFPGKTLDVEECENVVELSGNVFGDMAVGTYRLQATVAGKPPIKVTGSFDGKVLAGLPAAPKVVTSSLEAAAVKGFVPVQPGEHPRLLFRKADLPALRKRAETVEGKAILARLRMLLGGNGETFPTVFSPSKKTGDLTREQLQELDKPGVFTIGHAAGYGLLYQLTGEKKYADLGRQAFEKMMEGVRDVETRYALVGPGGELRSGWSWGFSALGYDLCYDGWDPEFRANVAKTFLTVEIEQGGVKLKQVVTAPKYAPSKNHFGGIIASSTAAAAIMGDPGTEDENVAAWMPAAFEHTRRMLTGGFGDHGFYAEGHGPSQVSAHTGLLLWLLAARNACGKDFITPAPNAQWITLRMVMEILPVNGLPQWMDRKSSAGASYGNEMVERYRSPFAQGFGAVDAKYLPALLWTYRNFVEANELEGRILENQGNRLINSGWLTKGEKTYDALQRPQMAVMAFVNWPIGIEPENPGKIMPRAMEDRTYGYYVFRNRWQDGNDVLVSALLGYGPKDSFKPQAGPIYLWGLGKKYSFGNFQSEAPAEFTCGPDGGVVATATQCLGVDFSGASGAPAVIALAGIEGPKPDATVNVTSVTVAGKTILIVTVQDGQPPAVKADGNRIAVGGQTIAWSGGRFVVGK